MNSRVILNHLGESTSRSSILLSSHVNIMFSNDGEVKPEREKGDSYPAREIHQLYLTFLPPSYAHVLIVESNTRGGYWISYSRLEFLFFLPTTKYAKKNRTVSLEIQHS